MNYAKELISVRAELQRLKRIRNPVTPEHFWNSPKLIEQCLLTAQVNPALEPCFNQWYRTIMLAGGRASSKSWTIAQFLIAYASIVGPVKILCVRQLQHRLADSSHSLLTSQIQRLRLHAQYKITNNEILNTITGTKFVFYGILHNLSELKSLEGAAICWSEESDGLLKESHEIIEPTIRLNFSQLIYSWNPRWEFDYVTEMFNHPPPQSIARHINYNENPYLSQTMLDLIDSKKNIKQFDFAHIYGGQCRSTGAYFRLQHLLDDNGQGWQLPEVFKFIFATVDSSLTSGGDGTGCIVWAMDYAGILWVLDWHYWEINATRLTEVLAYVSTQMISAKAKHKAASHLVIFVENKASGTQAIQSYNDAASPLLIEARKSGYAVEPIPGWITRMGKPGKASCASVAVDEGRVRLTEQAKEKTLMFKGADRNHLISQITTFSPVADKNNPVDKCDDLVDTFSDGICLFLLDNN